MSSGGPVHWKLGISAPVYPFKVAAQVSWYNSPSVLTPDDVMEMERDAIGKGKDTKLAKNEHIVRSGKTQLQHTNSNAYRALHVFTISEKWRC